jgi:hypothetical protein
MNYWKKHQMKQEDAIRNFHQKLLYYLDEYGDDPSCAVTLVLPTGNVTITAAEIYHVNNVIIDALRANEADKPRRETNPSNCPHHTCTPDWEDDHSEEDCHACMFGCDVCKTPVEQELEKAYEADAQAIAKQDRLREKTNELIQTLLNRPDGDGPYFAASKEEVEALKKLQNMLRYEL